MGAVPPPTSLADRYDAVIVGSGPNGLVAANLLADEGWRVVVLEAMSTTGGAVRSSELIESGFVNDHCSAFYPLAAASPVLARLDLGDHGLRWRHAPAVLAHPTLEGDGPELSRDLDVTAASLDADHPGDGDAWRSLHRRWDDLEPALLDLLFTPFPPVRGGAGLMRRLRPHDLVRFARFALLPVRRLGEEEFGGVAGRRLLAGAALHTDLGPEVNLSGFMGWLMCGLGQTYGFPVPEGGASALSGALVARLLAVGGEVHCDAPVRTVTVTSGRAVGVELADGTRVVAERAVLADVNAPLLYRRLVAAGDLPGSLLADLDRFQWDDATFKVDWTLDGPIPWRSAPARRAGTVHVAESVDELTVTSSELARHLVPAKPFLLVGQQSMTDATRAPAGKETAWAYTHVPRDVRGDAAGVLRGDWGPEDVERFAERIEDRIEALAPGFRDLVRGRHVMAPADLEADNPNLDTGSINGGTAALHQQLVFRPVPGSGRPSTPIKGLFLASGSAHPGGGVHGAAGSNAARAALSQDRRRRLARR